MKIFKSQFGDLFFTLLNQLWRLMSGPIMMLCIPFFLTEVQQGYWYLFGSISALSVFADLGFSNIILQFSAHEYAFLSTNSKGLIVGDSLYIKKLGSFFRFTIKWITTITLIVFPIIYIVGIAFFTRDNVLLIYILPWTLFSVGSLFTFFNGSILSFLEGINKIASVQKIRLAVSILNSVIMILVLFLGGGIYSLAVGLLISSLSILIALVVFFGKLLSQLLFESKNFEWNWKQSIVPLFMKYVLSFASGYFIFQIYTPLMHFFHGPASSGKVGITISLVTAIFGLSNIWIYTITPRINMMVSKKEWVNLDKLFKQRLSFAIGSYLFISFSMFVFILIFKDFWIFPKIFSRFLPFESLIILLVCYMFQLVINSWAVFLRGHKEEPYMLLSILSAILTALLTFIAGWLFPTEWFFCGFLFSQLVIFPLAFNIFRINRSKWHAD